MAKGSRETLERLTRSCERSGLAGNTHSCPNPVLRGHMSAQNAVVTADLQANLSTTGLRPAASNLRLPDRPTKLPPEMFDFGLGRNGSGIC